MLNYKGYKRVPVIKFSECTWPGKEVMKAPVWCSVDLEDGNQVLVEPMVVEEKVEMFNLLVKLGFKEIEVGFLAASQIGYDFLRILVERKLIPDDMQIQVLVQCCEYLIKRMLEASDRIKKAIVHIYNSTSTLQKDVVFHKDREDIKDIAAVGTKMVQWYVAECDTQVHLEYSLESFIGTELGLAPDICMTVQKTWGVTKENPIITNLPSTIGIIIPNVYADQIERMNTHFKNRENIILGVYPHNDRGESVTSMELALLAGADRVEGALFGNGERTGNVDTLIVAYNMLSQGVSPELNIENIREIAEIYERCTKMDIPPRHPYAGKLVFTAFSGPHQDAINKGMQALHERNREYWEVSHPPIDPSDIGREYEPIVRTNSQPGKDGVAFVMDTFYGFKFPKGIHEESADVIQKISEQQGEVASKQIMEEFKKSYLDRRGPTHFRKCRITDTETGDGEFVTLAKVTYMDHGIEGTFEGVGNGPIDAAQRGMEDALGIRVKVLDYSGHALTSGSGAKAVPYIHLVDQTTGKATYGVGISSNITRASIRGTSSAVNRLLYQVQDQLQDQTQESRPGDRYPPGEAGPPFCNFPSHTG